MAKTVGVSFGSSFFQNHNNPCSFYALLLLFAAIACLFLPSSIDAFNLDIPSRLVQRGAVNSMFGFAVDMYKHNGESWLLVGAPRSQTSQTRVEKGGSVLKCSTVATRCQEIVFDSQGRKKKGKKKSHNRALNGSELVQIDSKSNQWFGATVVASMTKDYVLACAPRYTYFYSTFDKIEPVGTCFLARNSFSDIKEYSPCRQERFWGFHRLGFCQAGFSAALPLESDRFFIGAPGAWYWQGSIIKQNIENAADIARTSEGPAHLDDSYLGYATTAGDFNGDGNDDVAVGMPKGNNLTGLVALYDHFLDNMLNISGEQGGSYFGAALAVSDIDGDGFVDIIVGAPLFTKYESSVGMFTGQYEVGKVYVYFQGSSHAFTASASAIGEHQWSRFGHAVGAAGDLNGDGFNDFIVGAPYGGQNRRGAVYVFHGMKGGMREKFSQVINAEDIDHGMNTFGFSVSGGRDVDDNDYPDVLIGAYKSDRAVLLKARPVITVYGDMKLTPDVINLEEKVCRLNDGTMVPCASMHTCISYTGKGAPQDQTIDLIIQLDTLKGGRAFFLNAEKNSKMTLSVPLKFEQRSCLQEYFYVLDTIRDKLTPIQVQANYSIVESPSVRTGRTLRPALDTYVPEAIKAKAEIAKDCGPDNVCVPDLQVSYKLLMCATNQPLCRERDKFSIGAAERANLTVTIHNAGEDAFESQFYLTIPPGLDYVRFVRMTEAYPATCSATSAFEHHNKRLPYNLICDIGNPLPKDRTLVLSFEVASEGIDTAISEVNITMKVNTTNPEDNATISDNAVTITIPLEVEMNLVVNGASFPEGIAYSRDEKKEAEDIIFEQDIGPNVTHVYEIRNDGPSTLTGVHLDIYWPIKTIQDRFLLYLVKDPKYTGNVVCKTIGRINPAGISDSAPPESAPVEKLRFLRQAKEQQGAGPQPTLGYEEEERTSEGNIAIRTFKRLVNKVKELGNKFSGIGEIKRLRVDCYQMDCVQLSCEIKHLQADDRVEIYIESRLWLNTVIDEAFYDATISSVAIASVSKVPYKHPPVEFPVKSYVVSTMVNPKDPSVIQRGIPWWLILIAILAGITFLILLILLLWRCGFFKRRRAPRAKAELTRPPEADYYGYSNQPPHYGGERL